MYLLYLQYKKLILTDKEVDVVIHCSREMILTEREARVIYIYIYIYIYIFAFNPLSSTRGHCFKITVPNFRFNARQHFFAVRVIPAWNYLSTTVVTSPSVCIF